MLASREFSHRRNRLMRLMKKNSVAVIASAPAAIRNRDVEYPYRQDSDFHYLTGFPEPEALAILAPGRAAGQFVLFCREYDQEKAIWTGRHAGLEGAISQYGADQAFPITELAQRLPDFLENRDRVYYPVGHQSGLDQSIMAALNDVRLRSRAGIHAPFEFVSLDHLLHEQRLFKSPGEIHLLRKAAEASVQAHKRAMRACAAGRHEYEMEAELLHEFAMHGMRSPAYPCIVAGGRNACVLHYTENDAILRDGDLLLIDAGAEHAGYAADITSTFPISGKFTQSQRLLYDLVLKAQCAALAEVKPGRAWVAPHEAAVSTLTRGLVRLGLLDGEPEALIQSEAYKKFYMHRTGHWLGMDVHDVGAYRVGQAWRELEPGMVLTVEPGLYIAPDCEDVDECWRGIGIRIEDDVLVTRSGHEVLTTGLPRSAAEIEAFMTRSS